MMCEEVCVGVLVVLCACVRQAGGSAATIYSSGGMPVQSTVLNSGTIAAIENADLNSGTIPLLRGAFVPTDLVPLLRAFRY